MGVGNARCLLWCHGHAEEAFDSIDTNSEATFVNSSERR
jgi:hypothetical protein